MLVVRPYQGAAIRSRASLESTSSSVPTVIANVWRLRRSSANVANGPSAPGSEPLGCRHQSGQIEIADERRLLGRGPQWRTHTPPRRRALSPSHSRGARSAPDRRRSTSLPRRWRTRGRRRASAEAPARYVAEGLLAEDRIREVRVDRLRQFALEPRQGLRARPPRPHRRRGTRGRGRPTGPAWIVSGAPGTWSSSGTSSPRAHRAAPRRWSGSRRNRQGPLAVEGGKELLRRGPPRRPF